MTDPRLQPTVKGTPAAQQASYNAHARGGVFIQKEVTPVAGYFRSEAVLPRKWSQNAELRISRGRDRDGSEWTTIFVGYLLIARLGWVPGETRVKERVSEGRWLTLEEHPDGIRGTRSASVEGRTPLSRSFRRTGKRQLWLGLQIGETAFPRYSVEGNRVLIDLNRNVGKDEHPDMVWTLIFSDADGNVWQKWWENESDARELADATGTPYVQLFQIARPADFTDAGAHLLRAAPGEVREEPGQLLYAAPDDPAGKSYTVPASKRRLLEAVLGQLDPD